MKVFADILTQGIRQRIIPAKTQEARDWYRDTAEKIKKIDQQSLIRQAGHRDYSMVSKEEAVDEYGRVRHGYEAVWMGKSLRYRRKDKNRLTDTPIVGSMYMFKYDAKHKDTLPFWDMYPVIFPFRRIEGGFLGINLHYLPPGLRAILMDGLYEYANNDKYNEATKIKLNYQLLKNTADLRWFKPCVKHYLTDHVRSKLIYIHPNEWDIAMMLPVQSFQKASAKKVWEHSRSVINKAM